MNDDAWQEVADDRAGPRHTETVEDVAADRARAGRSRRRRHRTRALVGIVLVLALLAGVVALAWPVVSDVVRSVTGSGADYEEGDATGSTTAVTIPEGATGAEIGQVLEDADVVASRAAFVDVASSSPEAAGIQPGTYTLGTRVPAATALSQLLDPASRDQITITIPEGFTIDQVIERVAAARGTDAEAVRVAASDGAAIGLPAEAGGNAEGWLAPATYTFEPEETPTQMLSTMVATTVERLDAAGVAPEQRQEVLTKASILEREVHLEEYFGKVARVIDNRLAGAGETVGRLQMDSTVLYGVGKTGGIPGEADLADDNPYNTYVHAGLPPTPIGSPGEAAIAAVLDPEEGPWLYFTTVDLDTGETKFATTLAEQQELIAELRAWRDARG